MIAPSAGRPRGRVQSQRSERMVLNGEMESGDEMHFGGDGRVRIRKSGR
jgi:hypothetical protein